MKKFSYFVAAGVLTSLLSGVGNVGICAGNSASVTSEADGSLDNKVVYTSFERESGKIEDVAAGKVSATQKIAASAKELWKKMSIWKILGVGAACAVGYNVYKRRQVKLYVYDCHDKSGGGCKYLLLDSGFNVLRDFGGIKNDRSWFLLKNLFSACELEEERFVTRTGARFLTSEEWQKMYGSYF